VNLLIFTKYFLKDCLKEQRILHFIQKDLFGGVCHKGYKTQRFTKKPGLSCENVISFHL